jgi:hypothetical protein
MLPRDPLPKNVVQAGARCWFAPDYCNGRHVVAAPRAARFDRAAFLTTLTKFPTATDGSARLDTRLNVDLGEFGPLSALYVTPCMSMRRTEDGTKKTPSG